MITAKKEIGQCRTPGRFLSIRSMIDDDGRTSVILCCDGGNLYFQHNMTPDEARELAGYLVAEANYIAAHVTEVEA